MPTNSVRNVCQFVFACKLNVIIDSNKEFTAIEAERWLRSEEGKKDAILQLKAQWASVGYNSVDYLDYAIKSVEEEKARVSDVSHEDIAVELQIRIDQCLEEINSYLHYERNREGAHRTPGLTEFLTDQFKAFEQRYQDERSKKRSLRSWNHAYRPGDRRSKDAY